MYRGVYAVPFDAVDSDPSIIQERVFDSLLKSGSVSPGDLVVFTKGDQQGVAGRTNTLQILTVPDVAAAPSPESG
jgi:pyruvate kinase